MRARLNYSHRKPEPPTPVVVNVQPAQPAQQQITERDVWLQVYAGIAIVPQTTKLSTPETWANAAADAFRARFYR